MVATKGDGWHLAASLVDLVAEADAKWPERDRAFDGSIGDAAHAARKSEHNPDAKGVVRAVDITAQGTAAAAIVTAAINDPRCWYVIHAGTIRSRTHGFEARPYEGDPHQHHVHISVLGTVAAAKAGPWHLGGVEPAAPPPGAPKLPLTLKYGSHGELTATLQRFLGVREAVFGDRTRAAVKRYQRDHGLTADGVVGPKTWAVVLGALKIPGYHA